MRSPRTPRLQASTAGSRIQAKAVGRSRPRSTRPFRRTSCRRRYTTASRHAAKPSSPTSCCRRCATSSAATSRSPPVSTEEIEGRMTVVASNAWTCERHLKSLLFAQLGGLTSLRQIVTGLAAHSRWFLSPQSARTVPLDLGGRQWAKGGTHRPATPYFSRNYDVLAIRARLVRLQNGTRLSPGDEQNGRSRNTFTRSQDDGRPLNTKKRFVIPEEAASAAVLEDQPLRGRRVLEIPRHFIQ